jgi:hypothetical protein
MARKSATLSAVYAAVVVGRPVKVANAGVDSSATLPTKNGASGEGKSVLLYKQLIRPMLDCACPIWRSAAHIHVRKLQVLQSKCLRIATNAPWYVSDRQIHDDSGIPFFADHIGALTEYFDSKLADARNPLVRQLGRHLCQPRAGRSHLRTTDED